MTMIRFGSVVRIHQYQFFIVVTLFVFFLFLIFTCQQYPTPSYEYIYSNFSNEARYERYCRQLDQRIKNEQISNVPIRLDPGKGFIPYSYSRWRSSPLLPRLITQCEHAIYIDLLSILIERVFKKYNIQYMMMAATLLGSYTRHDLLPWDDDVDIRVSISDRYSLQALIIRELSAEPYSVIIMEMHNTRNYDKVFFSWCPRYSQMAWSFPFIDIFYHEKNSTHVWLVSQPSDCPVRREDVFPLVLRPLGPLWLYGPREPMAHFDSRNMKIIETGCYAFPYSHKYERHLRSYVLIADCSKLESVYPYVKRQCTSDTCTEYLKLGDETVIHELTYNYAYRTFLYSETNKSYKAC